MAHAAATHDPNEGYDAANDRPLQLTKSKF